nr:hypothetical protein [Desulfitobacterium hafniense]
LLITSIFSENTSKQAIGKVSYKTSSRVTNANTPVKTNIDTKKLNFILGGGETGRIKKNLQEIRENNSENSSFTNLTTSLLPNAKQRLFTPTYEGSAQATHPSIIDFKLEYGIDKWHGYRYWMAMTPYPYSNDKYENPSILSSSDGVTWVVPPGFKNPVDIKEVKRNFNSDPAILYDRDTNTLNLYWREVLMGQYDRIWRTRIFENGKIEPKVLTLEELWSDKEGLALSPTIWKKSSSEWYMWTANGSSSVHIYTSTDGVNWSKRERCTYPWLDWNGGFIPWHLDAKPNYKEQRIEFFIAGFPKGKGLKDMVVFYAEAPMKDPKKISMPLKNPILNKGDSTSWDGNYVYRSSFAIETETDSYKYHVWYSAMSTLGQWRIGYTEGKIGSSFSNSPD